MTISVELSYAILALDSYNRGYNFGVAGLGGIGSMVGNHKIIKQSAIEPSSPEVAAGFYAAAYLNGGTIVISYRGTDSINPFGPDVTAWTGGLGFQTEQAELAAQFYYQVKQEYPGANIVLTGHSLGGGLAGLVARVTGSTAYIYDNMPFELTAERAVGWVKPTFALSLIDQSFAWPRGFYLPYGIVYALSVGV